MEFRGRGSVWSQRCISHQGDENLSKDMLVYDNPHFGWRFRTSNFQGFCGSPILPRHPLSPVACKGSSRGHVGISSIEALIPGDLCTHNSTDNWAPATSTVCAGSRTKSRSQRNCSARPHHLSIPTGITQRASCTCSAQGWHKPPSLNPKP